MEQITKRDDDILNDTQIDKVPEALPENPGGLKELNKSEHLLGKRNTWMGVLLSNMMELKYFLRVAAEFGADHQITVGNNTRSVADRIAESNNTIKQARQMIQAIDEVLVIVNSNGLTDATSDDALAAATPVVPETDIDEPVPTPEVEVEVAEPEVAEATPEVETEEVPETKTE